MTCCLSLVGMQPAATAAALRSWARTRGPVDRVVLLATPRLWALGERLRDFLLRHQVCHEIILARIEPELSQGHQVITEPRLDEWMSPDHELMFFADPGFNYLVAALALSLPPETAFMHADANLLHICRQIEAVEKWESLPYGDLSLEELADLYQFSYRETGKISPLLKECLEEVREQFRGQAMNWDASQETRLPRHLRIGLSFGDDPGQTFELGYVLNGRLHGLAVIKDKDKKELLQEARNLQSLYLNGLRPEITVLTDATRVAKRFHAAFTPTIRVDRNLPSSDRHWRAVYQSLLTWVNQVPANPGRINPSQPSNLQPFVSDGEGADGEDLAVCLGNDPSSTLTSLFTHKPQTAYVFYDRETPIVINLAQRIQQLSKYIPAGCLKFIPTDHLGRGILHSLIEHSVANRTIKLDITPGTKAQACAFTRFRGGTHWSLDVRRNTAVCLSAGDLSHPIAVPTLDVQARVAGGELKKGYNVIQCLEANQARFLEALLQLLVWAGTNDPIGLYELRSKSFRMGRSLRVNNNAVTVRWENETYAGTIPNDRQGVWLEHVTSWLLKAAGGDEVWHGVKWDWPDNPNPADINVFKDEIDVVGRFDTRFVAVSCKAGRGKPPFAGISGAKSEIEAVAGKNVGRLSIPLLVHVLANEEHYKQTINAKRGAVILGLDKLCKVSTLRKCLTEIFQSRRGN